MHFEILIEDSSGKKMLDILVPKILGDNYTFRVTSYGGIGRIPKNLTAKDPGNRILLDNLPKLLNGFGNTYPKGQSDYPAVVIVICDLDNKCLAAFKKELNHILNSCNPQPETRFCIAVEEGEAWLLGDIPAIRRAYPKADHRLLSKYENDAICGTWEYLEKVIGRKSKSEWAEKIAPHMNIDENQSPSFCYFRQKVRELIGETSPAK